MAAGAGLAMLPMGARASGSSPERATAAHPMDLQFDRPPRRGAKLNPSVCGVYCTKVECRSPACSRNPGGPNLYHCVGCGYSYNQCFNEGCVGAFCDCQGCC